MAKQMSYAKLGGVSKEKDGYAVRYYSLNEYGEKERKRKTGFARKTEATTFFNEKCELFLSAQKHYNARYPAFAAYLEEWFKELYAAELRNSTQSVYLRTLYNYILPRLDAETTINVVTKEYLSDIVRSVAKEKPSYGLKAKELFSVCFEYAKKEELVARNLAKGIKVPYYARKKPVILRKAQIGLLLMAAKSTNLYLEFLLAIMMGLRKGEIYGLQFSDINFAKPELHIQRQVRYETEQKYSPDGSGKIIGTISTAVEDDLKTTSSERILYIPDIVLEQILIRQQEISQRKLLMGDRYKDNGYVCGKADGSPRAGSALNSALNKLTAQLKLPKLSVHALRHIAATILYELGVPLPTISAIVGHESIDTTFAWYVDIMEALDDTADMLDAELGHLTQEEAA